MENNISIPSEVVSPSSSDVVPEVTPVVASPPDVPVRPEWLPEKFKEPQELAKSYSELETKMGGTFGAPEEYKWNLEGAEPDGVKLFKQVAKENNLSQKAFDEIVSSYIDKEKAILDITQKQVAEDYNKIGKERVDRVKNLIERLSLNEDERDTLNKFTGGLKEFETLEKILDKVDNSINAVNATNMQESSSIQSIDEELNKIYSDPMYRIKPNKFHARVLELTKKKMGIS